MALKITLRPGERMMIGGAVVTNGGTRSDLIIENRVPILRERDIMKEERATSPARRIYFIIQLMYMDEENVVEYHNTYWRLVRDVVSAAPSTLKLIDRMSGHVLNGEYYQALKLTRKLIEYEQEAINSVQ